MILARAGKGEAVATQVERTHLLGTELRRQRHRGRIGSAATMAKLTYRKSVLNFAHSLRKAILRDQLPTKHLQMRFAQLLAQSSLEVRRRKRTQAVQFRPCKRQRKTRGYDEFVNERFQNLDAAVAPKSEGL